MTRMIFRGGSQGVPKEPPRSLKGLQPGTPVGPPRPLGVHRGSLASQRGPQIHPRHLQGGQRDAQVTPTREPKGFRGDPPGSPQGLQGTLNINNYL